MSHINKLIFTLGMAAGVLAGWTSAAQATLIQVLSFEKLTLISDMVIDGTVLRAEAHWTPDHQGVYTDIDILVADPVVGTATAGRVVTVRQAGGELDGMAFTFVGMPVFKVGERVLLFLQEIQGLRIVVGLKQGKLPISWDPRTGAYMARRDLSDLAVISADGTSKPGALDAEAVRPVDLGELKSLIRETARRKAAEKAGKAR